MGDCLSGFRKKPGFLKKAQPTGFGVLLGFGLFEFSGFYLNE